MAIINGVDTSTIDYGALGRYLNFQKQAASIDYTALGNYLRDQQYRAQGLIAPPSPTEYAQWSNQRRAIADTYGNTNAQLEFDRGQALAQQSYETGQLAKNWDRARERMPGQYARRGLMNSGIWGGALQQYGRDRADASAGLGLKYQQQLGNIGLAKQRAQSSYTSGNAAVDQTETARRQELAATLQGIA